MKIVPAAITKEAWEVGTPVTVISTIVVDAFDEEGKHIIKEYETKPSKKACRWCEFNQTEYCTEGVR